LGAYIKANKDQDITEHAIIPLNGGMENIIINSDIQQVHVDRSGIQFDFGALGKGIALDKCKAVLQRFDINNALLSFGGSSILALGHHPHGEHWPVSLAHPLNSNEQLNSFGLKDTCLSISSTILHKNNVDKPLRKHLFHPKSGVVSSMLKSTAVITSSAGIGEAFSTALLIASPEEKLTLLRTANQVSNTNQVSNADQGLSPLLTGSDYIFNDDHYQQHNF